MKFYIDTANSGRYIYQVIEYSDEDDKYKEFQTDGRCVLIYKRVRVNYFEISKNHRQITVDRFNEKLIEAGMSEHVITTTLKSRILKAF